MRSAQASGGERWSLSIYIICFTIGSLNHLRDFLTLGWRPYRWGLPLLEIFWTSLIAFDLTVIGLLICGWRRLGLMLAIAVMAMDVAANAYALLVMDIAAFTVPLLLQTAFLGFVAGSIGFLWPRPKDRLA